MILTLRDSQAYNHCDSSLFTGLNEQIKLLICIEVAYCKVPDLPKCVFLTLTAVWPGLLQCGLAYCSVAWFTACGLAYCSVAWFTAVCLSLVYYSVVWLTVVGEGIL